MKNETQVSVAKNSDLPHPGFRSLRSRLKGRVRGWVPLLIAGIAVLGAGMAFKRDWLTAIGAAPIILSLAPCALMCTVGICCIKGGKQA